MISKGKHKGRAVTAVLGFTEKSGKEQVLVDFEIVDGPHAGEHISWFGFFTDATTDTTIGSLRHCGWKGDDLSNLEGVNDNEVELVVEHETYDNKERAKVRWVNKIGGATLKHAMTDAESKSFAARMRGAVIAQRAKGGAPPNGTARAPDRKSSDGDPGPEDGDLF